MCVVLSVVLGVCFGIYVIDYIVGCVVLGVCSQVYSFECIVGCVLSVRLSCEPVDMCACKCVCL